jgi:hypothetical protein
MADIDQVACRQAVLNTRSLRIRCVVDDQLSRGGQIMMTHGYHLEKAHFSDTDEYWSQHCRHGCDSGAHTIGPSHVHIELRHAIMPVQLDMDSHLQICEITSKPIPPWLCPAVA